MINLMKHEGAWALGIVGLLALVSATAEAAKPASESRAYTNCMRKAEYFSEQADNTMRRTTHCHYFGESCNPDWRYERVPARFDQYDAYGEIIINRTARLRNKARDQYEQCMMIIDAEGLE